MPLVLAVQSQTEFAYVSYSLNSLKGVLWGLIYGTTVLVTWRFTRPKAAALRLGMKPKANQNFKAAAIGAATPEMCTSANPAVTLDSLCPGEEARTA